MYNCALERLNEIIHLKCLVYSICSINGITSITSTSSSSMSQLILKYKFCQVTTVLKSFQLLVITLDIIFKVFTMSLKALQVCSLAPLWHHLLLSTLTPFQAGWHLADAWVHWAGALALPPPRDPPTASGQLAPSLQQVSARASPSPTSLKKDHPSSHMLPSCPLLLYVIFFPHGLYQPDRLICLLICLLYNNWM